MTFHSIEKRGIATRRLRYAIVASLLGHLLVFWPANLRLLLKDTPGLLQASLRPPPVPPTQPLPAKAAVRAVPSAPVLRPLPAVSAVSPLLEQPGPAVAVQPPLLPAAAVVRPSPGPAPVVAAVTGGPPAGIAGSLPLTEAGASGEAADGLRGYRLALAAQARRFKRYPAQALASGWAGSADVRVEVGSDGQPHAATLVRSSGHELLDQAALAMMDAGALRARLPESLRGKAFAVVLPVLFNLDEE
ncbi:MAG: TonB family protein [Rhodocyclales bacterium]|nr:TonB family protein [Rhodocyclales bacterium]